MLRVDGIDVFYGDFQALRDVSFEVDKGEIVAILGGNSAGKTTILLTISGILWPKSGSIEFLGERIDRTPPHIVTKKGICQVPQGRRLFPYMSVLDNLKAGAYLKKAREKMNETLEEVYSLFPILKERSDQWAVTLSGGEQQMLAIGRALMSRPTLLMLDEPSFGLAPMLVTRIFDTMKELNKQGVTILLVEQKIDQALEFTDRAYILETGRITLEGRGKALLNNDYVRKAYLGI